MIQKLFFAFLFVILCGTVRSQDTIMKTDGTILVAKITEVTPTEVKYKRFDLLDGPNFIELKENILKVKYSNGATETFSREPVNYYSPPAKPDSNIITYHRGRFRYKDERYSETGIQNILLNTKDNRIVNLVRQAKQARGLQYVGFVGIPLGIIGALEAFSALVTASNYSYSYGTAKPDVSTQVTAAVACEIAAIACPIVAVSYKTKRKRCNMAAITLFNKYYSKK
jgi:hypothetical protein